MTVDQNRPNHPLTQLSQWIGLGLTLITLLMFGASAHWRFALLGHLRLHVALGLAFTLLILLLGKAWRSALVVLVALIIQISYLAPLWFGPQPPITPATETLTITHINLNYGKVEALAAIATIESDLVFLQEVTPTLADALATKMPAYRVAAIQPLWTTHGSALLVHERWSGQIVAADFINLENDPTRPLLATAIRVADHPIALLNLHVIRPRNRWTETVTAGVFSELAAWAEAEQGQGHEVIIIGDFNNTPWSYTFQQLLQNGSLHNGQKGFGMRGTWPSALPHLLRIPIDHIIHSANLRVIDHQIGANVGSDHLPLTVTLAVGANN